MLEKTVVPTIFAKDKNTFSRKLELLEFSPTIHLDFMDGQFNKGGKSVNIECMKDLIDKNDPREFQIHLMANNPEKYIKNLLKIPQIYRVYVQYGGFDDEIHIKMSINEFKSRNYQVFIVLNPEEDVSLIENLHDDIEGIMIMSVVPGAEGQEFIEDSCNKIKTAHEKYPKLEICVDGGLNSETIAKAFLAGASTLCVGSYISSSETPKENYEKLKVLINS